ncbi:MAG: bifunctional (p)ppGpp synthetase/guanosine-3',5'-bis(diphosphate) 3'-pyrophosphohydrolase [Thiotrichaceae bacterium]|nr:bifunctional (p)ppGpp synthetase/guanosine-3',5'-bis(diphosphate) 3'-pyrophosphohydrolase [Thiotrichaceae bacterium]
MQSSQQTTITSIEELKKVLCKEVVAGDALLISKALDLVLKCHQGEGLPYGVEVALILHHFGVDQTTLIASILADEIFVNCTHCADFVLADKFSKTTETLVKSVRWLNSFNNCRSDIAITPSVPEQAERLRRMLLAMTDDPRAVLVKLAWRLHHLRNLDDASTPMKECLAQETLDIFTPLANRLGISQIKWELEDLSFRYIDPATYKQIAKALAVKRLEREKYIENFVTSIKELIANLNISAKVYGRPKHIYSIYKKMQRKDIDCIDQLYDIRAIRIITTDKSTCYNLLGEIHSHWTYIPSEYDDYIGNKKANGYQSLHTVVYGPQGKPIEIQIRTQSMHTAAELGIASHWRYKENGTQDDFMETAISALRELLSQDETDDSLLEDFKTEIFSDRVYALTPSGEVMDLPIHSTPIDFAYAIHTSIGHRCHGAIVNGKMVPLTYQLKNGEQVKILTQKNEQPKRRWLDSSYGYLQSSKGRNAVRHWLRQQDHQRNTKDGLAILEKETHRLGLGKVPYEQLIKKLHSDSKSDLLIAVGRGDISTVQISHIINPDKDSRADSISQPIENPQRNASPSLDIQVAGVSGILSNIANCCKPLAGDTIIGFTTMGSGVAVHRNNCPNIQEENLSKEQLSRLIDVSWGTAPSLYSVDINIIGHNQPGLLRDTTLVLATEQINITDITLHQDKAKLKATVKITVSVSNTEQLENILSKLNNLPNVLRTYRIG